MGRCPGRHRCGGGPGSGQATITQSIYCAGSFIIMFVSNQTGFKPRFPTWAFPALVALAAITTRRRGWQAIVIAFAILLPMVFLAYTSSVTTWCNLDARNDLVIVRPDRASRGSQ